MLMDFATKKRTENQLKIAEDINPGVETFSQYLFTTVRLAYMGPN